jgi:hypothetical protein
LTIEVIEAEYQAMLKTLAEHDFQDAFGLETVHTPRTGILRGLWRPVGPKLVLDQMALPVPKIMNGSLYVEPSVTAFFPTVMQ